MINSNPTYIDVEKGSRLSKVLALRYVLRHPVAFREYFVPKVSKRPYWGRYAFLPILLSLDKGDALFAAGRGSGKSFAVLEPELVRRALKGKGEETLLTTFRRVHVVDRMERAIDYFETVPILRLYHRRTNRSPVYHVQTKTGHNLYGISVGDDPEARMAQGKHASTIIIEEAHQYPDRAYKKLQGAKDPRGCNVLMAGVPDGQINTPFRDADKKYDSFEGRRVHISRRYDPWFDQKSKKDYADTLGGLDGDLFKQEIDAEWGSPTWSAWSLEAIYACMESPSDLQKQFVSISGKEYRENGYQPEMVLRDLPGNPFDGQTYIAADIGYTQPTEAGVFVHWKDKWWLVARVQMVNRTEHDDQAKILDYLGEKYGAYRIGIDTTDGQGRAIAVELDKIPRWHGRVDRVTFSENGIAGYTPEGEEIVATMKEIGTTRLRALFAHAHIALPKDEDIVAEFNQEKETKGQDGKVRLVTPSDVHIPEMMRVFSVMVHLASPPVPPEAEGNDFCLPVWGDEPIWQAAVV